MSIPTSEFDDFIEFNIRAIIKEDFLEYIDEFLQTECWSDHPVFDPWKSFLKNNDMYWICDDDVYYTSTPPFGFQHLSKKMKVFKPKCLLQNNVWTFAGALYNKSKELETFLTSVIAQIAENLQYCEIARNSNPNLIYYYDIDDFKETVALN